MHPGSARRIRIIRYESDDLHPQARPTKPGAVRHWSRRRCTCSVCPPSLNAVLVTFILCFLAVLALFLPAPWHEAVRAKAIRRMQIVRCIGSIILLPWG